MSVDWTEQQGKASIESTESCAWDTSTFNSAMRAALNAGRPLSATSLFIHMQRELDNSWTSVLPSERVPLDRCPGVFPDEVSYRILMRALASPLSPSEHDGDTWRRHAASLAYCRGVREGQLKNPFSFGEIVPEEVLNGSEVEMTSLWLPKKFGTIDLHHHGVASAQAALLFGLTHLAAEVLARHLSAGSRDNAGPLEGARATLEALVGSRLIVVTGHGRSRAGDPKLPTVTLF